MGKSCLESLCHCFKICCTWKLRPESQDEWKKIPWLLLHGGWSLRLWGYSAAERADSVEMNSQPTEQKEGGDEVRVHSRDFALLCS